MAKIVDLSVFENQTLDIKLPDGTIIKLLKPTQAMVINLMRYTSLKDAKPEDTLEAMNQLVMEIMNANDSMRKFTVKQIENEYNLPMKVAIIQAYSNFVMGLQSDPN